MVIVGASVISPYRDGKIDKIPLIVLIISVNAPAIAYICILTLYIQSNEINIPVSINKDVYGYIEVHEVYNQKEMWIDSDDYRNKCNVTGLKNEGAVLSCGDHRPFLFPINHLSYRTKNTPFCGFK